MINISMQQDHISNKRYHAKKKYQKRRKKKYQKLLFDQKIILKKSGIMHGNTSIQTEVIVIFQFQQ